MQATDKSVNAATRRFFRSLRPKADLVALGEAQLAEYIKTIGLFRNKAKNAIAAAQQLIERHGSEVPHDRAALERFRRRPQDGERSAVKPSRRRATLAVDTHVFRVANPHETLAPGKTVDERERKLNLTWELLKSAHHWLILHARYTCVAQSEMAIAWCFDDCEFAGRQLRAQEQAAKPGNRHVQPITRSGTAILHRQLGEVPSRRRTDTTRRKDRRHHNGASGIPPHPAEPESFISTDWRPEAGDINQPAPAFIWRSRTT